VAVQFAILGPVQVTAGGQRLDIGGPRTRAVLARLIVSANSVVSAESIAGELWPDLEPGRAAANLQVRLAELRRALRQVGADDRLLTRGAGYVLLAGADEVDAVQFEQLAAEGRGLLAVGDPARAAQCLARALALWSGPPLTGIGDLPWAQAQAVRLTEARLTVIECQIQARLECEDGHGLLAELEALTAENPLRERLWGQRMRALYRCGRQAEALAAYQRLRTILVEEIGIEPSAELRQLHQQILTQDASLDLVRPGQALAVAAPPVAAPPVAVPHELPVDVTAFTGRTLELAELDFLSPGAEFEPGAATRFVVIAAVSGMGGVGKTALAVHWAHQVADQFPDGQLYVNLRGYDLGEPVAPADALAGFLRALGVPDADIPLAEAERAGRYRSSLSGRRVLVLLDNAVSAEQVRPLLPGTGSAMVVVTSRDSLAGLTAVDGAHRIDLDLLPADAAVGLLRTLIGSRADADTSAASTLAALCARLPLALRIAAELAAARPDTPLAELATELAETGDRLAALDVGGDPRGAVTVVFSWSYRQLRADAARMFRLLGLHPAADWDAYAAAALSATSSLAQARTTLGELARAHLIQPASPGRYEMHDLLRAYAAGLATHEDADTDRHAALSRLFDYYLASCAVAMDCLAPAERQRRPAPPPTDTPLPEIADPAAGLAWLDAELPTLTQIAVHTAGHGWPGHATRLAVTLYRYLFGGRDTEALVIHTSGLAAARQLGDRTAEAHMLTNLGFTHDRQSRYEQAAECHDQALILGRATGDRFAQARAVAGLAVAHHKQGRYQLATDGYERALGLFRELGDLPSQARQLQNLSTVCLIQQSYEKAADHARLSLQLAGTIGDHQAAASALSALGEACCELGDYSEAHEYYRQAAALAHETGYKVIEATALAGLGDVWHHQGSYAQAIGYHEQAVAAFHEIANPSEEAGALVGMGRTMLAAGHVEQARDCYTSALTIATRTGYRYHEACAHHGLADALRAMGDATAADQHAQRARDIYRQLGLPEPVGILARRGETPG
jgi:DNA-binding SARP family transcriptional activator/Tfp pilus assembly protein PilF